MSSDVTLDELSSTDVKYYLSLIAFSILVYEYCLTFGAEVERFWCIGRLNWASGFFYLNRYLVLFGHIIIMLEYFWTTSNPNKNEFLSTSRAQKRAQNSFLSSCHHFQSFHQYFAIVVQVVVACMLIMRIYALYGQSRKVLALYIVVSALIVAVGCWAMLGGKKEPTLYPQVHIGCGVNLSRDKAIRLGIAWSGMLIFDSLVFYMTLYKSIRSSPGPRGACILNILMRDGAIYFGVIMVSNLGNILTFLLGGPFTRGIATMFTNVISSVMMSRLMLNLRTPSHPFNEKGALFDPLTTHSTYPNLTFVELDYPTQISEVSSNLGLAPSRPGRAREMYHYLAEGSSRRLHESRY